MKSYVNCKMQYCFLKVIPGMMEYADFVFKYQSSKFATNKLIKMQQIVLKIDNQIIENQIIELSKYQNEPIEKICLDAILYFINMKMLEKVSEIELKYKILDINKTENKLHFEIDNSIEFESIELFPEITSGAEYISHIRKSDWRQ